MQKVEKNHLLLQNWERLSFMHWEVDKRKLTKYLPSGLELDFFRGKTYVGVIPFFMKGVRPRWGFSLPFISSFPEFNIRIYVKHHNISGVYFITLDAQSFTSFLYANLFFKLPYMFSRGSVKTDKNINYWKTNRLTGDHKLEGFCEGYGDELKAGKGTIEEFFLERYYLFTQKNGRIYRGLVDHSPWKYRLARPRIIQNSFLESYDLGIKDYHHPDFCYIAISVEVKAWALEESIYN